MNLALAEKEKIIEICKRNDISYCAVFGSYARGEATEESDIDRSAAAILACLHTLN